ncbi:methionine synthase [Prauserella marina]|uniref:Methionine synthase n=1 Tax=Prauserella marina TaxID=530584 RepID=A0A222W034_9PSEU|nr:methionine synthase [Prauserella marina]ASR39564.1 methionine synthase [Prauserella marina]PWV74781.1 methionine synthase (B12-dependent) [Prauserella marina]SDD40852.1 5-methyltetrahydrofolate--homocysteine methyltransferase [Prauserella marina]
MESGFLAELDRRVLVADGGMGTALQEYDLTLDDFAQLEGCNEILNETRPDVVSAVYRGFLEAGSDAIESNTFGTNLANLGEYGIADRIRDLAERGTALARQCADEFSTPDKPRFVLGSVGPGTKLPTLGHAPYAALRDAYVDNVLGMLDGGADAVLVETSQDLLQTKAAIVAAKRAMAMTGRQVPVIAQVTVETTGTMLVGSEIGAALTALEPLGIDLIGMNCATGPAEMSEHLRVLAQHATVPISVMPNAGLPELGPNGAVYPLRPDELAEALAGFITRFGARLVGGCCGTTGEHIRAVSEAVADLTPKQRTPEIVPSVSSVYQSVPFEQDASILNVGERTNANGSKAFREAMLAERYDDCVEIAKSQTREGAHMLDLCVDYVGRDGTRDMRELASRLATASTLPIMVDSTEAEVVEAGLEHLGGRCAVNSVNYEDGAEPGGRFHRVMEMVVEHGATVVVTCIDEEGQARTADWKLRVAERAIDDLTGNWGLDESAIIIDCLVFPITTGQEEVRKDAIETINAIRELKRRRPRVQTTLGLSNVSFGLNPAARQVLNSVFLNECRQAGLDSAIVNSSKILPMNKIEEEPRQVALDLVYDRRTGDYDPLQKLMQLFEGKTASSGRASRAQELAKLPLFERLERRIVDGERNGLDEDLAGAMAEKEPLRIINENLLAGMKVVGELFGSGQMQLPFVLQSAEVMKAAVAYLEPHMEKDDSGGKGKLLLATVKGDVHDIGKNLVDIIVSNNGYDVVNIGIKQPINAILDAAEEHRVDAIGMSGLLVKSTVIMKDNLQEMNARGVAAKYPVLLGGAALTRTFVENDLDEVYEGDVRYAKDAFEGLNLMDRLMSIKRGESPEEDEAERAKKAERKARRERSLRIAEKRKAEQSEEPSLEDTTRSDVDEEAPVPVPAFWGSKVVKGIATAEYLSLLDERATFFGQWGLRGAKKGEGPSYEELVETEGRPRLRAWMDELSTRGILANAAVVYGYFPCYSDGNDLVVLDKDEPDAPERLRFSFPRQRRDRRLCLADFFRSKDKAEKTGEVDVLPLQLVTMGQPIADHANELFAKNAYRDYLEIHGLGVQLTEALAEYWHRRVRQELLFTGGDSVAAEDPDDVRQYFKLGYRGARFSLGYGACPDLEDRAKIVELLGAERIGVELSEEFQLHPEQSTDAIVLHHPEAKYFNT